ncbi:MAG: phosphoribosyltransferase [Candidatus Adiutrix sp.]|jgi:hypothetical protein|nr:phosphoribosyltransferase [Candidatus Adiutrix sp.]
MDNEKIKSTAWPKNFPHVMVMTTIAKMKEHADYTAAKCGDMDAAVRLISDIATGRNQHKKIQYLAQKYPDAIISAVYTMEHGNANQIPQKLASYIGIKAGLAVDTDIVQLAKSGRTGEDIIYRLACRPKFTGNIQAGRRYIIVDDVVTMGTTLNEQRQYIEQMGGHVVAFVCAATAQFSHNIALSEKTKKKIIEHPLNSELLKFLEDTDIYGGHYESLTESEARAVLKIKNFDAARNRIFAERQVAKSRTFDGENRKTRVGEAASTGCLGAKRGPKPKQYNEDVAESVRVMAKNGTPLADIAKIISMSPVTLSKLYHDDFLTGKAEANNTIGHTLYEKAVNGDTVAAIFWAKTQMGWRETQKVEVTQNTNAEVSVYRIPDNGRN